MKRRPPFRLRFRRAVPVWHRRIGLATAPFVALLVVSGILLNHTEELGLDRRFAAHPWLLSWYGVEADAPESGFPAGEGGERWVAWAGGRIYLDGAPAGDSAAPLAGAVAVSGLPAIAAAAADAVWLFAADGSLIEKAAPVGVPLPIEALAAGPEGALFLRAGGSVWAGDADLVEWRRAAQDAAPAWARPAPLPPAIAARIAESRRGEGLPWERVLLDLHSGRLFGALGPPLMDAAAVLLVLLAASGLYNWTRTRR